MFKRLAVLLAIVVAVLSTPESVPPAHPAGPGRAACADCGALVNLLVGFGFDVDVLTAERLGL